MIAASVTDATTVNPNDIKTLLDNGKSRFLINGKLTFIYGSNTLPRNPPFWFLTFLVVQINKIPLFSKYLITFIIYSISFIVSVLLLAFIEPITDEIFYQEYYILLLKNCNVLNLFPI